MSSALAYVGLAVSAEAGFGGPWSPRLATESFISLGLSAAVDRPLPNAAQT